MLRIERVSDVAFAAAVAAARSASGTIVLLLGRSPGVRAELDHVRRRARAHDLSTAHWFSARRKLRTKECSGCHRRLQLREFYRSDARGYLRGDCRRCNTRKSIAWRKRNSDRSHGHQIKHAYGISGTDYQVMLKAQRGRCAICRKKPVKRRLGVDHDHRSGRVRGLLCVKCNLAIGYLNHRPSLLAAAGRYLHG